MFSTSILILDWLVGEIKTVPRDVNVNSVESGEGGHFSLELNTRIYTLRAKNEEEAEAWVGVLKTLQQEGTQPVNEKVSANAMKGKASLLRAESGAFGERAGKYVLSADI